MTDIPHQLEGFSAELTERYAISHLIGEGGMGLVFRATDRKRGLDVALKVIRSPLLDPELRRRMAREIDQLSKLAHPGLVRIHDGQATGPQPYIAMELLEGEGLHERLSREAMSSHQVRKILLDLLDGLAHVHQVGVLHRDIKPTNIFLRHGDVPVLIDFGLARPAQYFTRLTRSGAQVGTPRYLAPELLSGTLPSVQSDLFALGLSGLEALTRVDVHARQADPEPQLAAILSSLSSGVYHTVAARALAAHGELGRILLKALSPEPERRYGSALAMREELERLGPPAQPAPMEPLLTAPHAGSPPPRPRRAPVVVLILAVLGLFGLGLSWALRTPANPPVSSSENLADADTIRELFPSPDKPGLQWKPHMHRKLGRLKRAEILRKQGKFDENARRELFGNNITGTTVAWWRDWVYVRLPHELDIPADAIPSEQYLRLRMLYNVEITALGIPEVELVRQWKAIDRDFMPAVRELAQRRKTAFDGQARRWLSRIAEAMLQTLEPHVRVRGTPFLPSAPAAEPGVLPLPFRWWVAPASAGLGLLAGLLVLHLLRRKKQPLRPQATLPPFPARYRDIEYLGEGGMGIVLQAMDTQLD